MENLRDQRTYGSPHGDYEALKQGVAVVSLSHRTLVGLSGKDPIGLLAAILSNEIPAQADLGSYGLLLDAKGRVQTDLRILKRPEGELIAETGPEGEGAAREILGRYAPFSRVSLDDLSGSGERWGILGLYGPKAPDALAELLGETPALEEHQTFEAAPAGSGTPLLISGVARPAPGYDLIGPTRALQEARESLLLYGATPADHAAYEAVRVEAGVPRFGVDLTPENFPAEAGILDRAVSFAKGCYPGQETVARMHYRGHPNRLLYRLLLHGEPPETTTPIFQDEKEVGRLTSVSPVQTGGARPALGYLHRKADPEATLHSGAASLSVRGPAGGA